jgi:zinc transporter ZupT
MEAAVGSAVQRPTYTDVLRVTEFRAIWAADVQSMVGDQVARVALTVLIFTRTGSAALTGLTYALTYLPSVIGGALLSPLADRFRRRSLMIWCDLSRMALLTVMALPRLPLPLFAALLVVVVLIGRPFVAAENALLPDILSGEAYALGSGLRTTTLQVAQLVGFAGGGALIAAIGPYWGVFLDAVTFAVSAVILRLFVHERPRPTRATSPTAEPYLRMVSSGVRLVFGDPRLRTLMLLAWLAAFYTVPEGLAAPYAAHIGAAGARSVGLLLAAIPTGTAIATWVFIRWVPPRARSASIGWLASLAGAPLVACITGPSLAASIALWIVTGLCCAYQAQAAITFVQLVDPAERARAFGLAAAGLLGVQGIGILLFSAIAQVLDVEQALALAGLLGMVLAVPLAVRWARLQASVSTDGEA